MLEVYKNGKVFYKDELLMQHYSTKGMKVYIEHKEYYVHKLVAERFLEDYKPFYKVAHKDGDVTNNHVDNLKVVIPLDSLEVAQSGKRAVTLQHKKTGTKHRFDTLREASTFMGYKNTYLEQWFYTYGKDELSWFHDYTIVKIAPKDTRVINRKGKTIFLKNRATGELHYFTSLAKASVFLGKGKQYLKTRLNRGLGLPLDSEYEIMEIQG